MTDTGQWVCPTCRNTLSTPYCPACGERALGAKELTLRGLLAQTLEAFTSIDGRLIHTIRSLVGSPGLLTKEYLQGRRKPYLGPVSLFLLVNVVFFAAEALTGGSVFTAPLASHLHAQPWSEVAESMVSHRLQARQTALEAYTPDFDRAMARNARSFIIFMALSFGLLPGILFRRSTLPFVAHVVFALHLYAFLLLLFCIATTLPPANLLFRGGGISPEHLDAAISLGLLAACAGYIFIATGVVYGGSRAVRAIKTLVLTLGVATIVLGYRFTLFLVTLYST